MFEALAGVGLRAEAAPPDILISCPSGRSALVRLLAAAAPHHRGGRGSLGLHWMLPDTPAEFVTLVDLSRRQGWLLPIDDFRAKAQPFSPEPTSCARVCSLRCRGSSHLTDQRWASSP